MASFELPLAIAILILYAATAALAVAAPAYLATLVYRHRMEAIRRRTGLNPYVVPLSLRALIPAAHEWGIADDLKRRQYQANALPQQRRALSGQVLGKEDRVRAWLTLFRGDLSSKEASAFHYLVVAMEEMSLIVQPPYPTTSPSVSENPLGSGSLVLLSPNQAIVIRSSVMPPRLRVFRLRGWLTIPVLIALFIGFFIVLAKAWGALFPSDSDSIGIVVVNCVSGAAALATFWFFVGLANLLGSGRFEVSV